MNISQKLQALHEIRVEAMRMIDALRNECPHDNYTVQYKGDTGNWCQSDDSYWVVINCPDCGHSEIQESVLPDGSRNHKYYGHSGREEK